MGERDGQAPSALRLVGMLTALVLLFGGVVAPVVLSVGAAMQRALGPQETDDGSICNPITGTCYHLSRSAIEAKTGISLPAEVRVEASGSTLGFKSAEAWAVVCAPDQTDVLQEAQRAGYLEVPISALLPKHDWFDEGPVTRELKRSTAEQGVWWLDVGSSCDQGTYVYLGYFLDK